MNVLKMAKAASGLFDRFAKDYTPYGQGISILAHGLLSIAEEVTGQPAPAPSPNIAHLYADADDDGIEDNVDDDHGTIAGITDAMIHAANPIVQNWLADVFDATRQNATQPEFPFAAVYLAMHGARPKKTS
jgi:hypothetical protein